MAKKILLSFKENEEEIKLYLEVIGHPDKSAFIKEVLKYYLDNTKDRKLRNKKQTKKG